MILRLALQKIRAMAGGYGFFAAVLAAAFALFFIIAATLGTTRTQLLRIALTDEDDSPLSHEFAELLNDSDREITDGKMRFVSVRFGTREESEEAVRSGKAEGALIILKGFGAGLESGEEAFLEYRASADASSAQAAEEIIGGRAVALRSRLRSADYAKKLLNRGLTEKELSELEVAAKEYYNEQVGAVRFERIGGSVEKADSSVFGALRARFSGIGAFAVLTLLLTLGSWTGSNAARAAEKRLAAEIDRETAVRLSPQNAVKGNLVDDPRIIKAALPVGKGDCAAAAQPRGDFVQSAHVGNEAGRRERQVAVHGVALQRGQAAAAAGNVGKGHALGRERDGGMLGDVNAVFRTFHAVPLEPVRHHAILSPLPRWFRLVSVAISTARSRTSCSLRIWKVAPAKEKDVLLSVL